MSRQEELSTKLQDASAIRDKIGKQIFDIESDLVKLRAHAKNDFITKGESDLTVKVGTAVQQLDILQSAMADAQSQVDQAQQECDHLVKAERYSQALAVSMELRETVKKIRTELGESGLNATIDHAFSLIDQIGALGGDNGQGDIGWDVGRVRPMLVKLNHFIYLTWNEINGLPWSGSIPLEGSPPNGITPGFGRYRG